MKCGRSPTLLSFLTPPGTRRTASPPAASAARRGRRRPLQRYEGTITRLAANPLARRVKLADLEDNMDPKRRLDGPEGAGRLAKYQAAWKRLAETG